MQSSYIQLNINIKITSLSWNMVNFSYGQLRRIAFNSGEKLKLI